MNLSVPLHPFPGAPFDGLVTGVTAPTDSGGAPLDLRDPAPVIARLAATQSAPIGHFAWLRQVHGTTVLPVEGTPSGIQGEADAMVTSTPGVVLLTRHADCPPIVVWDRENRAVGLAHSGRRGTVANIAGSMVATMEQTFRSKHGELRASIGPGVRACCYAISEDTLSERERVLAAPFLECHDGALYLDLHAMIAAQLHRCGVDEVFGAEDAECTCCGITGYHSYRRDKTTMRFAALAGILP